MKGYGLPRTQDHEDCRTDIKQDPKGKEDQHRPGNLLLSALNDNCCRIADQCKLYYRYTGNEYGFQIYFIEGTKVILYPNK